MQSDKHRTTEPNFLHTCTHSLYCPIRILCHICIYGKRERKLQLRRESDGVGTCVLRNLVDLLKSLSVVPSSVSSTQMLRLSDEGAEPVEY